MASRRGATVSGVGAVRLNVEHQEVLREHVDGVEPPRCAATGRQRRLARVQVRECDADWNRLEQRWHLQGPLAAQAQREV
jgi:hypothetical protein